MALLVSQRTLICWYVRSSEIRRAVEEFTAANDNNDDKELAHHEEGYEISDGDMLSNGNSFEEHITYLVTLDNKVDFNLERLGVRASLRVKS